MRRSVGRRGDDVTVGEGRAIPTRQQSEEYTGNGSLRIDVTKPAGFKSLRARTPIAKFVHTVKCINFGIYAVPRYCCGSGGSGWTSQPQKKKQGITAWFADRRKTLQPPLCKNYQILTMCGRIRSLDVLPAVMNPDHGPFELFLPFEPFRTRIQGWLQRAPLRHITGYRFLGIQVGCCDLIGRHRGLKSLGIGVSETTFRGVDIASGG